MELRFYKKFAWFPRFTKHLGINQKIWFKTYYSIKQKEYYNYLDLYLDVCTGIRWRTLLSTTDYSSALEFYKEKSC